MADAELQSGDSLMSSKKQKFDQGNVTDLNVAKSLSRKKFHPHDLISLRTKSDRQDDFLQAYYSQCPLIMQYGCAGTGKTFMALYAALSEVFDPTTSVDKVIIVRSAVQTRDMGFMPGDDTEKNSHYEAGYRAMVNEMISTYNGDQYDNLKSLGYLEFKSTSFLRSTTYDRAVIIIDEMQSCTYHELSTVITRCGLHSKVVLCGDHRQDDLASKSKREMSGFGKLMEVISQMPTQMSATVEYKLDDIVRSGLVKAFLTAEYGVDE